MFSGMFSGILQRTGTQLATGCSQVEAVYGILPLLQLMQRAATGNLFVLQWNESCIFGLDGLDLIHQSDVTVIKNYQFRLKRKGE